MLRLIEMSIIHFGSREDDIDHSVADISKAEIYLEYQPEFSLEDGLKRIID